MANIRRRRASFAVRGARRATQWGGTAASTDVSSINAATKAIDQAFTEATLDEVTPATIVRVRAELWVKSDQVVATERPFGAIGCLIVSEEARVAGAASIPGPMTNDDSDQWFMHQYWATDLVLLDSTGFQGGNGFSRFTIDSRAMRKINKGEALVTMIENKHATHAAIYYMSIRTLFKLH